MIRYPRRVPQQCLESVTPGVQALDLDGQPVTKASTLLSPCSTAPIPHPNPKAGGMVALAKLQVSRLFIYTKWQRSVC